MKIREIKGIYYNLYASSRTYKPTAKSKSNFAEILDEKLSARHTDTLSSTTGCAGPVGGVRILVIPRMTQPVTAELDP